MALDFVALDFETANAFRGSPCAVGLVKVGRGMVTEKQSLLMRPPAGHDHFDPWNLTIHGITAKKVMNEPRFVELWPQILGFVEDLPVVSHYAAFDLGVIREACIESTLPWPNLRYACTLVLGRMTYRLLSHRLPFVAEAAGLPSFDHHDAGQDCCPYLDRYCTPAKH
jgi:DNA polymerase III subunit epsilon